MRLLTVLLLTMVQGLSVSTFSQSKIFSFDQKNIKVKDVFKLIETQSQYRFFFNDDLSDVNRKVDIYAKDLKLDQVLSVLLGNTRMSYKILESNLIVIAPKDMLQQEFISGTIIDGMTGELLKGIVVTSEGSDVIAVSDAAGHFNIDVPSDTKDNMMFSGAGYFPQTFQPQEAIIIVRMMANIKSLEQIIVVGYGVVERRRTGR